jgi:hypothetical protein
LQDAKICYTLTASNVIIRCFENPTNMKNQSATIAKTPSIPLKLAYSSLMETLAINTEIKMLRPSPYKKLFQLHEAVQVEKNWDDAWFSSYE